MMHLSCAQQRCGKASMRCCGAARHVPKQGELHSCLIICCCVLRCCNSLGTGVWPGKHAAVRNSLQAAEVKLDSVQLIDTASLSKLVLPSMNSSNSAAVAVARSTAADVPGSVVAVAPRKWYSPSKKYVVSLQEDQHLFIYLAAPPNTVVWQTFIFYSDVTSEVKLLLM
eukprot:1210-Heterococcus_DN1.PRE.2